jgi:hypothetical protein
LPRALLAAALSALLAGCRCSASPEQHGPEAERPHLPPIRIPNPIGVGMGIQVQPWYLQPGDLARIRADGFSVVRWGIPWERVEKAQGVYDWSEVDRFVSALAESDLRSVVILAYGNRLYLSPEQALSGGAANPLLEARPPVTQQARAAFARFAAAAAARYRNQPIMWEIWNEPDNRTFWAPSPDPRAYATVAGQACAAIREASPKATIIGAAGAAMPNAVAHHEVNLYSELVRSGALGCLDGLSGHAYRMSADYEEPDPESIEDDNLASRIYLYSRLRVAPQKRFVVTEWGFTTYNISANLQAAYLIRANLMNATTGVPLTIWYEWRDSRSDAGDPESHFGLYSSHGGPKNTVGALPVLSRIAQATLVRRIVANREDARVFLLEHDGAYFLAAWQRTSNEAVRARLYVNGTYRTDISYLPALINVTGPDGLSVRVGEGAGR